MPIPVDYDQIRKNDENFERFEDALNVGMDAEDFPRFVDDQMDRAKGYWRKIKLEDRQKLNVEYWHGEQVDRTKLRDDLEHYVENAIFRNIETFIPIATARPPELIATASHKNEETRNYTGDVQKTLTTEWDVIQGMRHLLGRGIRNHCLEFLGVYKLGHDEETGEFWTEEIPASDVVISKDGSFIAQYIKNETLREVLEKFPGKEKEIKQALGMLKDRKIPDKILDSPFEYIEAWTDELVGWKYQDVTLDLMPNPHFDYEGREIEMPTGQIVEDEFGEPMEEYEQFSVNYNYFKKPKKPFIFLTYWNRGIHVFDDTTIVEQGIGPQNWINKRKRQIGMNADSTNGHWVSSGEFISQEEFMKIEGGIDEKIWLERGMPADGLAKITGQPLPDYIHQDLIDSRSALDNIMGTHSTTRGEVSGNKTATQDIMAKESDFGRVDGYIRDGIESFARKWYEYMYHMYLVYRVDESFVAIPEEDDFEQDNISFSRNKVPIIQQPNGEYQLLKVLFQVKQGSTVPNDDAAEYAKARDMKDVLAPFDYFKKVNEPNPRELTKNLLMWQMDPTSFFEDDEDVMRAVQKKQMMEQQAAMAAAGGGGEGGGVVDEEGGGDISDEGLGNALRSEMEAQGGGAGGGDISDEGLGNALRAEMEEQGMV